MRYAKTVFTLGVALLTAIPLTVWGATGPATIELNVPLPTGGGASLYSVAGIGPYFTVFFAFVFGVLFTIAIISIIWSGIRWITSAGNPSVIKEQQHNIINGIMGFAVALFSYYILYIINPDLTTFKGLNVNPVALVERCPAGSQDPACSVAAVCCAVRDTNIILSTAASKEACNAKSGFVYTDGACPQEGISLATCSNGTCLSNEFCSFDQICLPRLGAGQTCAGMPDPSNPGEARKVCIDGYKCISYATDQKDTCVKECDSDTECGAGYRCNSELGVCTQGFADERCGSDTDCNPPLVCNTAFRNTCSYPGSEGTLCDRDKDCADGYICNTRGLNECVRPPTERNSFCNKANECGPGNCDCVGETAINPGLCVFELANGSCSSCENPSDPRCN